MSALGHAISGLRALHSLRQSFSSSKGAGAGSKAENGLWEKLAEIYARDLSLSISDELIDRSEADEKRGTKAKIEAILTDLTSKKPAGITSALFRMGLAVSAHLTTGPNIQAVPIDLRTTFIAGLDDYIQELNNPKLQPFEREEKLDQLEKLGQSIDEYLTQSENFSDTNDLEQSINEYFAQSENFSDTNDLEQSIDEYLHESRSSSELSTRSFRIIEAEPSISPKAATSDEMREPTSATRISQDYDKLSKENATRVAPLMILKPAQHHESSSRLVEAEFDVINEAKRLLIEIIGLLTEKEKSHDPDVIQTFDGQIKVLETNYTKLTASRLEMFSRFLGRDHELKILLETTQTLKERSKELSQHPKI